MTSPSLNYQTPPPTAPTPLRTGTWIYLLVLGILYCLGALLVGLTVAFVFILTSRLGLPRSVIGILVVMFAVAFLIIISCGVTYIWSALRIRKGSRSAAITAMIVSIVNAVGILALLALGLIGAMMGRSADISPMIASMLVYFFAAAANGVAAFLLARVLRELRRAAYLQY